jgi:antitoxin HigA-1
LSHQLQPLLHPGQVLKDHFMEPYQLSINAVAKGMSVTPNRVLDIIHGRRSITPDTAQRLGKFFWTSTQFWTDLQTSFDSQNAKLQAETLNQQVHPYKYVSGVDFDCLQCGLNTKGQEIQKLANIYPWHHHVHKKCYAQFITDKSHDPDKVTVRAIIPATICLTLQDVARRHYDEHIALFVGRDQEVVEALTIERDAVMETLFSLMLAGDRKNLADRELEKDSGTSARKSKSRR